MQWKDKDEAVIRTEWRCFPAPSARSQSCGERGVLMSALRSIALAISLLLAGVVAVHAQAPAAAPSGMTQQQFDSLVDAISKSVAEKLKADGIAAPPKTAKPAAAASPDAFGAFFAHASEAARAVPTLGRQFATIPGLLDESERGGRGPIAFLLLLGLVAVAAVLAEEALRRGLGRLRVALASGRPAGTRPALDRAPRAAGAARWGRRVRCLAGLPRRGRPVVLRATRPRTSLRVRC